MNLNPLIAKLKPNGNVQCLVCNAEVKAKIWTAHVNGKKHRDNIEKLKASSAQKRVKSDGRKDEPPSKRMKGSEQPSNEGSNSIPSDFFDSAPTITTPFQKPTHEADSNTVEGLPQGFFDDKKLDEKSRDTKEKMAELDKEFERWREEIGEEQIEQDAKREQKELAEQRELEIERIDEQMAALKKLNDLEIQKEKRLNKALERRMQREQEKAKNDEEMEDIDDIDLDDLDWRSKNLFG